MTPCKHKGLGSHDGSLGAVYHSRRPVPCPLCDPLLLCSCPSRVAGEKRVFWARVKGDAHCSRLQHAAPQWPPIQCQSPHPKDVMFGGRCPVVWKRNHRAKRLWSTKCYPTAVPCIVQHFTPALLVGGGGWADGFPESDRPIPPHHQMRCPCAWRGQHHRDPPLAGQSRSP